MSNMGKQSYCHALFLSAVITVGVFSTATNAAVLNIGVQYQEDNPFTEYQCWYRYGNYPTSCAATVVGCNVNVFLKNTGTSSVAVNNVFLAGYNLSTILKRNDNYHNSNSIYYYWDDPPQAIFDAGEPIWFRVDPPTIPAGGVSRVVVRLRTVPVTKPVSLSIVTSVGTVSASVPVNNADPVLASVGFSTDRKKVYLTWRRSGGAAPTTIKMDDVDVTANAVTVGDPGENYAMTLLTFGTAITNMSYHVYQGVYSDGKTATGAVRTWYNRFLYGTWGAKSIADNDFVAARAWIDTCNNRGVNALVETNGSGGLADYMGTSEGRAYMEAKDYGYVKNASWGTNPRMWFIEDEPDIEEGSIGVNMCGTGLRVPCGSAHFSGIRGMYCIGVGESLRSLNPLAPTTINLDGNFKPDGWYAYGQLADVMMVDSYYEQEMAGNHWNHPERDPLYPKPTVIYATAIATTTGAEPNPMHMILYSCEYKEDDVIWPFAAPGSKRIQAYYALAGGAKGMAYWWFKKGWPFNGLDTGSASANALWKEIGLIGVEIKTLAPQIVTSHPVNMTLTPGSNVWARALACGTDTVMLVVVNDNFYNDTSGIFHNTPTPNATVAVNLPSWMQSSPYVFEVKASGVYDLASSQNGGAMTVQLGTLSVTKMVVITTNPQLRADIQQRYDTMIRPGVCAFAPEQCVNNPPSISLHPSNQSTIPGGSAAFTVVAGGTSPLSYQWQKNSVNLTNTGHYSGVTTGTLTISNADTNDTTNYRCVVSNAYGTATSNTATLTLAPPAPPSITQQPSSQSAGTGTSASFTVAATGTSPLSYQWQKSQANLANGGHYSGATTATLVISNVDSNDAAAYRCVVTNSYGSATSNEATLAVTACVSPTLTNGNFEASTVAIPPSGWTTYIASGKSGNWTIQAASPVPQGTQWQQTQMYNTSAYGGIRQNVTTLTSGTVYTITGSYRTNSGSATASVRYNLAGNTDRSSSTILASTISTEWGTFSGTVTASGTSLMLFLDHENGTSSNKASAFDNIVVSGCGVSPAPAIAQHPVAQSVCPGTNASFTVAATGSGTLTYIWQKNGANMANSGHYSGVTTATLAISGADSNDAANYRCVVSNANGSATSNQAALTLKQTVAADLDGDCDVDQSDFDIFAGCASGPTVAVSVGCEDGDLDDDNDVDQTDFGIFQRCYSGENVAVDPNCEN